MVHTPTTDKGTLIDHVYCNSPMPQRAHIHVADIYYSDKTTVKKQNNNKHFSTTLPLAGMIMCTVTLFASMQLILGSHRDSMILLIAKHSK